MYLCDCSLFLTKKNILPIPTCHSNIKRCVLAYDLLEPPSSDACPALTMTAEGECQYGTVPNCTRVAAGGAEMEVFHDVDKTIRKTGKRSVFSFYQSYT